MQPRSFPITAGQFMAGILTMVPATCALASDGHGGGEVVDWQTAAQIVGTLLLMILVYFAKKIYEDTQDNKQQLAAMAVSHEAMAKNQSLLQQAVADLSRQMTALAEKHAELEKKVRRRRKP